MRTRPDKIDQADWGFVPTDPDPDFNPEHNKKVIRDTIEWNERYKRLIDKDHENKTRERIQAISTYLKSTEQGGRDTDIKKYFGRRYLAYLRGQEVVKMLKQRLSEETKEKLARRLESKLHAKAKR